MRVIFTITLLIMTLTEAIAKSIPAEIQSLVQAQQYMDAATALQEFVADNPNHQQAKLLLGETYARLQLNADAKEILQSIVDTEADGSIRYKALGKLSHLYLAGKQYQRALDVIHAQIQLDSKVTDPYRKLGDVYTEMASRAYAMAGMPPSSVKETASIRATNSSNAGTTSRINSTASRNDPCRDDSIRVTLENWAKAWSNQDSKNYFAHYSNTFVPQIGNDLTKWRRVRDARINNPKWIKVSLSGILCAANEDRSVTVTFAQKYASDIIRDVTRKTMKLIKNKGQWHIVSETVKS